LKDKVLFVCIENACRSQIAQALTDMSFRTQLQAFSAGSHPADQVNPKAIASLKRYGIEVSNLKPKSVGDFIGEDFDFVITMGCGDDCPFFPGAINIDWNIPDPKNMNEKEFDEVRDMILRNILDQFSKDD
tara:strand:- start:1160 stop:1552 length:393 start_codon:yes stop_codon:yes gene_type:complete